MKSSSLAGAQQHRNLSDRVAHHLMEHIRTNGLASGERLPSEMRVSADLKISRGIVREAYRALRSAGILDISNGRHPRVLRVVESHQDCVGCHDLTFTVSTRKFQTFDSLSLHDGECIRLMTHARHRADQAA